MFPGCPEHCKAEGPFSKYSRNIACRQGTILPFFQEFLSERSFDLKRLTAYYPLI